MAANLDEKVWYYASDMVLNVHLDASYMTARKAHSTAGGFFPLASISVDGCSINLNKDILALCTILI